MPVRATSTSPTTFSSAATTALVQLVRPTLGPGDIALALGTAFGALDATVAFLDRLRDKGPSLVNPMEFPNLVHNAPTGHASMVLGLAGPNVAACQEELAGDEAVRLVREDIARGRVEGGVAVGGDLASVHLDAGYRAIGMPVQHATVLGALALSDSPVVRLGLSAVIEEADGRVSYWALAHPAPKPDFHHAGTLALQLPKHASHWPDASGRE